MKFVFYCDVYPWTGPSNPPMVWSELCQSDFTKVGKCTRYRFEIDVPDPRQADVELGTLDVSVA